MSQQLEFLVPRFIYRSTDEIWFDEYGFLIIPDVNYLQSRLIDLESAIELPGGILIAEGGMGKSYFAKAIVDRFSGKSEQIILAEFSNDSNGLEQKLDSFSDSCCSPEEAALVFLDGLDEAPELATVISRKISDLPSNLKIWIASRNIDQVQYIRQKQEQKFDLFFLAPLSREDVHRLSSKNNVNSACFIEALKYNGLLPMCAKPMGVRFAIKEYHQSQLKDVTQSKIWQEGIRNLCDETPNSSSRLLGPPKHTLDKIVACAEWIALTTTVGLYAIIWTGDESRCPHQAIELSKLANEQYDLELLRTTISRGIFQSFGDGRVRFSHEFYRQYLAAKGFLNCIPRKNWERILFNPGRTAVYPEYAGLAAWLAARDDEFLEQLVSISPETILGSIDAIRSTGADKLCNLLLKRASKYSRSQLDAIAQNANLSHLKSHFLTECLKRVLISPDSLEEQIELATSIAEACDCKALSNIFASRFLDSRSNTQLRKDAGYVVCKLNVPESKQKLKSVLPIDPIIDSDDCLLGLALRSCWPKFISVEEIVKYLRQPQQKNLVGAYRYFLEYEFMLGLTPDISKTGVMALLKWALQHLCQCEPPDYLGELARKIYSYVWRQVNLLNSREDDLIDGLAKGYLKALEIGNSPFTIDQYTGRRKKPNYVTKEEFRENRSLRLRILDSIIQSPDFDVKVCNNFFCRDYPLATSDDRLELFEKLEESNSNELKERYALCILEIRGLSNKDEKFIFDRLHSIRPEIYDSYETVMEERARSIEDSNRKNNEQQQKRKEYEEDLATRKTNIEMNIREALDNSSLDPKAFCNIAQNFFIDKDLYVRNVGIDLTRSHLWEKLESKQRENLVSLAYRYLTEVENNSTKSGWIRYGDAQALTLVRNFMPKKFAALPEEVWLKCGAELLKLSSVDKYVLIAPLLDHLSQNFPKASREILLSQVGLELNQEQVRAVEIWGNRLTSKQVDAIFSIIGRDYENLKSKAQLLQDLCKFGFRRETTQYLDNLFSDGWANPEDDKYHELRMLAFKLEPKRYYKEVFQSLKDKPKWSKQLLLTNTRFHFNLVLDAFLSCPPDAIADIYIWLDQRFPPEDEPRHDGEAKFVDSVDNIYRIKNYIITHLMRSGVDGSELAITKIYEQFPDKKWLRSCIIGARLSEQTSNRPVLSPIDLKQLLERRNNPGLIFSERDLLDEIVGLLEEYQIYLQGDNPAVIDIWDTTQNRPKDEEQVSNHIARFLKSKLSGIAINREVQIRQKLYKHGKPGSRTDIWINGKDKNSRIVTLCIEVKCNWNRSACSAIKDQLIDKYLSGGSSRTGLYVLCWFDCKHWDENDNRRRNSKSIWDSMDASRQQLEQQAEENSIGSTFVQSIVLDCSLN